MMPDELMRGIPLVSSRRFIAEHLAVFAEASITTLLISPMAADPAESVRYVKQLLQLRPA